MSDLVIVNRGQVVVSSRQVAENFRKDHRNVLASIKEIIGVAENSADLFYETTYVHPQNKQQYTEYLMNRDGFTLLAMGFTGKKAIEWKLKYIQAFNAMEEQLKKPIQIPQTYAEALRMLADEVEKKQELIEKIDVLTPKAEAFDVFINGEGFYNMGTVAKMLGIGRTKLFKMLRDASIIMKSGRHPYQSYIKNGWFAIKAFSRDNGFVGDITLVTPKGVDGIRRAVTI